MNMLPEYKGIVVYVNREYPHSNYHNVIIVTITGEINADLPKSCTIGCIVTYVSDSITSSVRQPLSFEDAWFSNIKTEQVNATSVITYSLHVENSMPSSESPIFLEHFALNKVFVERTDEWRRGDNVTLIVAYMNLTELIDKCYFLVLGWIDSDDNWHQYKLNFLDENYASYAGEIYQEFRKIKQAESYSSWHNLEQPGPSNVNTRLSKPKFFKPKSSQETWSTKDSQSSCTPKTGTLPKKTKQLRANVASESNLSKGTIELSSSEEVESQLDEYNNRKTQHKKKRDDYSEMESNRKVKQTTTASDHMLIRSSLGREAHNALISETTVDPELILPRATVILDHIATEIDLLKKATNMPSEEVMLLSTAAIEKQGSLNKQPKHVSEKSLANVGTREMTNKTHQDVSFQGTSSLQFFNPLNDSSRSCKNIKGNCDWDADYDDTSIFDYDLEERTKEVPVSSASVRPTCKNFRDDCAWYKNQPTKQSNCNSRKLHDGRRQSKDIGSEFDDCHYEYISRDREPRTQLGIIKNPVYMSSQRYNYQKMPNPSQIDSGNKTCIRNKYSQDIPQQQNWCCQCKCKRTSMDYCDPSLHQLGHKSCSHCGTQQNQHRNVPTLRNWQNSSRWPQHHQNCCDGRNQLLTEPLNEYDQQNQDSGHYRMPTRPKQTEIDGGCLNRDGCHFSSAFQHQQLLLKEKAEFLISEISQLPEDEAVFVFQQLLSRLNSKANTNFKPVKSLHQSHCCQQCVCGSQQNRPLFRELHQRQQFSSDSKCINRQQDCVRPRPLYRSLNSDYNSAFEKHIPAQHLISASALNASQIEIHPVTTNEKPHFVQQGNVEDDDGQHSVLQANRLKVSNVVLQQKNCSNLDSEVETKSGQTCLNPVMPAAQSKFKKSHQMPSSRKYGDGRVSLTSCASSLVQSQKNNQNLSTETIDLKSGRSPCLSVIIPSCKMKESLPIVNQSKSDVFSGRSGCSLTSGMDEEGLLIVKAHNTCNKPNMPQANECQIPRANQVDQLSHKSADKQSSCSLHPLSVPQPAAPKTGSPNGLVRKVHHYTNDDSEASDEDDGDENL